MSQVNGDLLASSSLLTAIVGTLYSVWYSDLARAADINIPANDATRQINTVTATLRAKAYPLVAMSLALVALLAGPTLQVIHHAFNHHGHVKYDPVQACFVVVFFILVFLAATTANTVRALRERRKQLQLVPDT